MLEPSLSTTYLKNLATFRTFEEANLPQTFEEHIRCPGPFMYLVSHK
jgi:hypothetical protein